DSDCDDCYVYDDSDQEDADSNDATDDFLDDEPESLAVIQAHKASNEAHQKQCALVEGKILQGIRGFLKKHKGQSRILKAQINIKEKNMAEIAKAIGDFYSSTNTEWADYFYTLSATSFKIYSENEAVLALRDMYIREYSGEIAQNNPRKPTASLFNHLKLIIKACEQLLDFGDANDQWMVAACALPDLYKLRSMIVRWHVSAVDMQHDLYYGPHGLLNRIYTRQFIESVLSQAEFLLPIRQADRYDASDSDSNLLKLLKQRGFYGVYQSQFAHNWVHPSGWVVRVKVRNGRTEYTIGLSFQNPIMWDAHNRPVRLALYPDGSTIAFNKYNEIVKLAFDGNAPFIIPAFLDYYWYDRSVLDEMMRIAHFHLPNGFGTKKRYPQTNHFYYSLTEVESLLTF
ncbi:MAG: hypothetical protein Q8K36_04790, partial [Alphaproteobacteria bacterium]|nr:hypothetical protein [Alphaproteobacteria bacterium]